MKRIFLAIDVVPDADFLKALDDIRHELQDEPIKWVDFKRLHLTLKFFGETEEAQIRRITEALDGTVATRETLRPKPGSKALSRNAARHESPDPTSGSHGGLQLYLASLGVFRNVRNPQVIWIGCDKPEAITGLKDTIDRALEPLGILPEKRDFSPHFTLGRIKHMRSTMKLARLIERYGQHIFCMQEVKDLILYESILKPQGPEYIPLEEWKLAAG